MNKNIEIEAAVREAAPDYKLIYMEADVENTAVSDELRMEMSELERKITEEVELSAINKIPAIAATRKVYKALGKDPNRYRPSQEQMMRRIVRGLGLYTIDSLVDTGNLVSLTTGCSLGVFDRDKIVGGTLRIGVGKAGEPYTGIGRGDLNIEGLPVVRDAAGGIGTPTSDHERTKVSGNTRSISICLHVFDSRSVDAESAAILLKEKFIKYCNASAIEIIQCC